MTVAEMRAECEARGVPYRLFGPAGAEDCMLVLDMTQLPGEMREKHLRQDGYLRGHGPERLAPPVEAEAEAPKAKKG